MIYQKITKYANSHFPILLLSVIIILLNTKGVFMVKIEEKGKVTFGQAFKDYFRGYVDFKGRTTRAGYWWMTLVLSILALIFILPLSAKLCQQF